MPDIHRLAEFTCDSSSTAELLESMTNLLRRELRSSRSERRTPGSPSVRDTGLARFVRELADASRESRTAPDLLDVLPTADRDRGWVLDTLATMRGLRERFGAVQLLECRYDPRPDGSLTIAAHLQTARREVRRGDHVCAGFAVSRTGANDPQVLPRIYRPVCTNGAIAFSHLGEALDEAAPVDARILTAVGEATLMPTIARLRAAAEVDVHDPAALAKLARVRTELDELLSEFEAAGDRTGWGMINAATALARRETNLPRRLELERDAERILAALESGAFRSARAAARSGQRAEREAVVMA